MTVNFNALRQNNQLYCWKRSNKYVIICKMPKITANLGVKFTMLSIFTSLLF
jgi:hypothetical protein